jgi:hypothetical protein
MRSELLPAYVGAALEENEDLVADLSADEVTLDAVMEVCRNYRVAAIGSLLLTGRSRSFRHRLHQSGAALADFLSRTSSEMKLTSKSAPFLDAIAAGDMEAARRIATASRRDWVQGEEYEEDFLFFDFLMRHSFLGAAPSECEAILVQYNHSLAGTEDTRLDVCRAFLSGQSDQFEAALERFLVDRSKRLDALADRISVPNDELATIWHLSVEGVAFVRLARAKSMIVRADYLHVPSTSLEEGPQHWTVDDWRFVGGDLD